MLTQNQSVTGPELQCSFNSENTAWLSEIRLACQKVIRERSGSFHNLLLGRSLLLPFPSSVRTMYKAPRAEMMTCDFPMPAHKSVPPPSLSPPEIRARIHRAAILTDLSDFKARSFVIMRKLNRSRSQRARNDRRLKHAFLWLGIEESNSR